jgi:transmembrane sensor
MDRPFDPDPADDDVAPPPRDPALEAALAGWATRTREPVDVEGALARVTARRRTETTTVEAVPPAVGIDQLAARRAATATRADAAPRRARLVGLAAAAVLVLGLGATLLGRGGAGAARREWRTAVAQLDTVALDDGTRIVLGPASTLVADAGYGDDARTVRLVGEATFTVVHDAARPFAVRTAAGEVVDLGTVFTVRAGGADALHVQVTEGEVELRPAADPRAAARLRAGDAARLEGERLAVARASAVPADAEALAQRRLAFRDAPVAEVREALQRWYGLRIDVADSVLLVRHVTADYTAEPGRRVVGLLALALGAEVAWRGDTATLRAAPPDRR